MIPTIALFLAKIFGGPVEKMVKWVNIGLVVLIAIALVVAGLWLRSCFNRPAKLNEKAILKAQQAIAENDRQKMTEVLVESEVAEKSIDANLANAENQKLKALQDARKKAAEMTNEELAAELESRINQ